MPLFCWMCWDQAARQVDVLLERNRRLGVRKVVVDSVLEYHPDKGQPVKRGGANHIDSRRG